MAKILTLEFVDGSSKECEVTGREMGDESVYYVPLSSLKPGIINFLPLTEIILFYFIL